MQIPTRLIHSSPAANILDSQIAASKKLRGMAHQEQLLHVVSDRTLPTGQILNFLLGVAETSADFTS